MALETSQAPMFLRVRSVVCNGCGWLTGMVPESSAAFPLVVEYGEAVINSLQHAALEVTADPGNLGSSFIPAAWANAVADISYARIAFLIWSVRYGAHARRLSVHL